MSLRHLNYIKIYTSELFKYNLLKKRQLPEVINFSITNICNYRCTMCNLWKKEYSENRLLKPRDIERMFSDTLFRKVKHVGISGGEPFLNKWIGENTLALMKVLPNLKGISLITNGSLPEAVRKFLDQYFDKLDNLSFGISLDGVDFIHDKVRGKIGAFESALKTFEIIREHNVPVEFHTTISKGNLDYLDELLYFYKLNDFPYKFRIGTKITRLYNNTNPTLEFSELEVKKITVFLMKVLKHESDVYRKLWYQNLIQQLEKKSPRGFTCHWQNKGVSVDPKGNLYYCFAKSKKIGNLFQEDGLKMYYSNLHYRDWIIRKECPNCIHDYVGIPRPSFLFRVIKNSLKRKSRLRQIRNRVTAFNLSLKEKNINSDKPQRKGIVKLRVPKEVVITGWYGTETLGDKAILAGIIGVLKEFRNGVNVTLTSITPNYTSITVNEIEEILGKNYVGDIVNFYDTNFVKNTISKSQLLIMGGGPLMQISEVLKIEEYFRFAKNKEVNTSIFGCGIGPFNRKHYLYKSLLRLLKIADQVHLRDATYKANYPEVEKLLSDNLVTIDPAAIFLNQFWKQGIYQQNDYVLVCIRDWPRNYCHLPDKEYRKLKDNFEHAIVELVHYISSLGLTPLFFPMHTFPIGNDDRDYFVKLRKQYSIKAAFFFKNYTVSDAVSLFQKARAVVAMRFHSAVFGVSLGIPTIAIDYDTRRGKVEGFMKQIGMEELVINIKEITVEKLIRLFNYAIKSPNVNEKILEANEIIKRRKKTIMSFFDE